MGGDHASGDELFIRRAAAMVTSCSCSCLSRSSASLAAAAASSSSLFFFFSSGVSISGPAEGGGETEVSDVGHVFAVEQKNDAVSLNEVPRQR